MNKAGIPL
jgi:chromosome segregation ATPase